MGYYYSRRSTEVPSGWKMYLSISLEALMIALLWLPVSSVCPEEGKYLTDQAVFLLTTVHCYNHFKVRYLTNLVQSNIRVNVIWAYNFV